MACVVIPGLALQVVQSRRRERRSDPVVVVANDGAQARITYANERALGLGVAPGMRYAVAIALVPHLHAATVSDSEKAMTVGEATRVLRSHSPEVEPSDDEPGVFWTNVSG